MSFKLGSIKIGYEANSKGVVEENEKIVKSVKKVGGEVEKTQTEFEKLEKVSKIGLGVIAGGALAVGGGILALSQQANDYAREWETSISKANGSLGLNALELQKLEGVAKQTFKTGFGENIQDIMTLTTALYSDIQNLSAMSQEELTNINTKVYKIATANQKEYAQITSAVGVLQTEFGISADKALNMVNEGFQTGLNKSDDFLDSVREYSGYFKNSGASADNFFTLLKNGYKGGVVGTDKISDLYKEFGIRINTISDTQVKALKEIGINSNKFLGGLKNGSKTTYQAFLDVITVLKDIKDPISRNSKAIELLGTPYEDLGFDVNILTGYLKDQNYEWGTSKDSLDKLNDSVDQQSLKQKEMERTIQESQAKAFQPLNDKVNELKISFFNLIIPIVENETALNILLALMVGIAVIAGILAVIFTVSLIPAMWAGVSAGWALVAPFLPIMLFIALLVGAIIVLAFAIYTNFESIKGFFFSLKDIVVAILKDIGNYMIDFVNGIIDNINNMLVGFNLIGQNFGMTIELIPKLGKFARGGTNIKGGVFSINETGKENMKIGDTLYMPYQEKGLDIYNTSVSDNQRSRVKTGENVQSQQIILKLEDVSDPVIIDFFKQNKKNMEKAGVKFA